MTEKIDYARIAKQRIRELVDEFKNNPYNFFSESDVKCRLFLLLYENDEFKRLKCTTDGKLISPLHTEVTYFNDRGKLLFHVDLSAIEPKNTNVYSAPRRGEMKLAKGYRAGDCYFAIEIKLNRTNGKPKMLARWIKDIEKLEDIRRRNPLLTCFAILLDKKGHLLEEAELFDMQRNFPQVKIVYANANSQDYFINF